MTQGPGAKDCGVMIFPIRRYYETLGFDLQAESFAN
jgi:hypothetical protein